MASASANTTTGAEEATSQTRQPGDFALMQQRMKTWQPLLSPKWVIACYFVIAITFIPVGES
jgi:hypothetical protein